MKRYRLPVLCILVLPLLCGGCRSMAFWNHDKDADGLPDSWESQYGLSPRDAGDGLLDNGPSGDPDGDTISNLGELGAHTNPTVKDTDADGLTDGEELGPLHTNPLDPADGRRMMEELRSMLMTRWAMVNEIPLAFTNAPGSPDDLEDLRKALNALSGKFYSVE